MHETTLHFPSADGTSRIRALLWEPDDLLDQGNGDKGASLEEHSSAPPARCILQILHGMAEHIERYRDFAEFCTAQGIIVCGHDHVGHGKSVTGSEQWGHLPARGKEVLIEDTHRLRLLVQERYSATSSTTGASTTAASAASSTPLPYFMLGHSMGSFVLRNYLATYADGITAAIISGTGQQPALLSAIGSLIAQLISATKGAEHRSTLLFNLSVGAYSKQIENAATPLDWLSTDETIVQQYFADPACGFKFDAGGNHALTQLTGAMVKRRAAAAVPANLPLLFIAGSEDPVGEKGAAVQRAVAQYRETGHTNVTLILYEGMRHEVLNEKDRARVYQDVAGWIEKNLSTC